MTKDIASQRAIQQKAQAATYSTRRVTEQLIKEINKSLKSIDSHGSVEIFVQNSTVTQITVRNIKKTDSLNSFTQTAQA
jgi:hypothetical protein